MLGPEEGGVKKEWKGNREEKESRGWKVKRAKGERKEKKEWRVWKGLKA